MHKKINTIPVNAITDELGVGIAIFNVAVENFPTLEGFDHAHRHDAHMFFLLEQGTVTMDIDFQKHCIGPFSLIYMHPSQVHRVDGATQEVSASGWAMTSENIKPEYLKLLEEISPVAPLIINQETFSIFREASSLCVKLAERKDEKLYHSLLKDSCNTLVALILSQYLLFSKTTDTLSRAETITKDFKVLLDRDFIAVKTPKGYAQALHLSTPYLNECVKKVTGFAVSYHIQQRNILEAKRLLYHSPKSVKEIASELGYGDYPYFSRLFTKVCGMSALTFRSKNRD
jgi:AraC family transcriptional activator of pobA